MSSFRIRNILTAMLLGALVAPVFSIAEEQGEKVKEQKKGPGKSMLEKYDTDKDGKLSDEEKAAMKEARKAEQAAKLEKYDTDKDGKLSPEELKKYKADRMKEGKVKEGKLEKGARKNTDAKATGTETE